MSCVLGSEQSRVLSIVGYRGPGGAVTIPDTIKGLTVAGKLDEMCHCRLPARKLKTSGATLKRVQIPALDMQKRQ